MNKSLFLSYKAYGKLLFLNSSRINMNQKSTWILA